MIETAGFNGYTKLDTAGHPHSKDVKFINTFLRKDSRTMEHTVTVIDPKMYTQPWMNVRTWRIRNYPDVIMEYSCEENNEGFSTAPSRCGRNRSCRLGGDLSCGCRQSSLRY